MFGSRSEGLRYQEWISTSPHVLHVTDKNDYFYLQVYLLSFSPSAAFEEAEKNAPAIIFIDELDAIAPKRDKVNYK